MSNAGFFSDNENGCADIRRDEITDRFALWTEELTAIIESKVFGGTFEGIFEIIFDFDEKIITRLSDSERDDQLTFCSQYKGTLTTLRDDVGLYLKRVNNHFESWYAGKYKESYQALLDDQKREVKDGYRTKGQYGQITKDEIRYHIISEYKKDYDRWLNFIERVERAYNFAKNMAADLEHRAMTLMSLRRTS